MARAQLLAPGMLPGKKGVPVIQGWQRQGTVLPTTVGETDVGEPNVIRESGAIILTGTVFKMWYRAGVNTCYAESLDGITWTRYGSNPVLADHTRPYILKVGAVYWMYSVFGNTRMDLYTSADGVTWALDTSGVLNIGVSGWDSAHLGNMCVWQEGANDWRMIYEADAAGARWAIGYATSADGKAWTKYASNPVLTRTTTMCGGPQVIKKDATYYMWLHYGVNVTGNNLPTDIGRYTSADLITWTADPANPVYPRRTVQEGYSNLVGQAADVHILQVGQYAYFYYAASPHGNGPGSVVQLSIAPWDTVFGTVPSNAIIPYPPIPSIPAITGDWYDPFGDIGAHCLAAYTPKGAADLAASYLRTYGAGGNANLDPVVVGVGVAPTWNATDGWIFNGTTQFLDTGVVPAVGYSMVVMFSNKTGAKTIAGCYKAGARFEVTSNITSSNTFYASGGVESTIVAPILSSGVLGIAGYSGFKNGLKETIAVYPAWSDTTTLSVWVANRNGAANLTPVKVQAIAIYDSILTDEQMYGIYTALQSI